MTREDLSFISIQSFRKWAWMVEPYDFKDQLQKEVQAGRDAFRCSRLIKLPHMVMTEGDLFAFDVPPSRANFVTTKQVVAAPVSMSEDLEPHDLQSRIVFIEGADPGYDWIFAHGIAGLVTKYGGAASHMTIRAAEFGIPAAIGCGEGLFEGLRDAKLIELNCAARQIHAV